MENLEKIYDEQIHPLMQQIIAICKEHQLPMFAEFQYSDENFYKTALIPEGHPVLHHYNALSQCKENQGINVDKYMMWLERGARKTGHSSIYLNLLGIPEKPEALKTK